MQVMPEEHQQGGGHEAIEMTRQEADAIMKVAGGVITNTNTLIELGQLLAGAVND
jgi:hypothetical protein